MITWVVTSTAKAYEILSLLTTFNCEKLSTQPHIFSEAAESESTLLGSKGDHKGEVLHSLSRGFCKVRKSGHII